MTCMTCMTSTVISVVNKLDRPSTLFTTDIVKSYGNFEDVGAYVYNRHTDTKIET